MWSIMRLARMRPNNRSMRTPILARAVADLVPRTYRNSSDPKLTSFVADRYPNLGNGAGFKPPAFECLDSEFVE